MTARRLAPLPYPNPALSDGCVGLRHWCEADVDCVRLAGTDPDIPQGTSVPAIFTVDEGLAFIHRQWTRAEKRMGVSQAIVEVGSDRAVGLMWVAVRPQPYVGGLGDWVVPPVRGQGVATAAVRMVGRRLRNFLTVKDRSSDALVFSVIRPLT